MSPTAIAPIVAAGLMLLLGAAEADAQPSPGYRQMIVRSYETSEEASDGSSGTSQGRDGLLEQVVAVREGGIELEYDLPDETSAEDRARQWQLPARVLRRPDGSMELLNRAELEARVQRWLESARLSREACGRWIFTWNAFRIECDPQAVLITLADFDLRSADVREGATYRDPAGRGVGTLRRTADGPGGARFVVVLEIDPDAARRARAEADVVAGEIVRRPVTLDTALRRRAAERISGTIEVTFETDPDGSARRRIKVTRLEINEPGGRTETHVRTETLERNSLSGPAATR